MNQIPPAALYADITITPDHRWTRVRSTHGEYEWEHVPCFRFTDPDGRTYWADRLSPEQALALNDVKTPTLDELITANGY